MKFWAFFLPKFLGRLDIFARTRSVLFFGCSGEGVEGLFRFSFWFFTASLTGTRGYNSLHRTKLFSKKNTAPKRAVTRAKFKLSKNTTISGGCLVFKRWVPVLIALVFFVLAFLIQFQQKLTFGIWFQMGDLHHETFAIASVALGLGVLIGAVMTECKK